MAPRPGSSSRQAQIGQEVQAVVGLPGGFVAGQHRAGPVGQPGDDGLHLRVGQHVLASLHNQRVAGVLVQQIQPGPVGDPGRAGEQPFEGWVHV